MYSLTNGLTSRWCLVYSTISTHNEIGEQGKYIDYKAANDISKVWKQMPLTFLGFFFNSIEIRVFSSCKQMNSPLRKDNIARSVKDEKRFKISSSKVKISSALSRLNSPTYMIWYLEYQIAIDGKGIAFYDLGIWYVCIFLEQNVRN